MSVTINVLRRTSQPPIITYTPTTEQANPITWTHGKLREAINSVKSFDNQEIKDIENENLGSASIDELTEMKHRKLKKNDK